MREGAVQRNRRIQLLLIALTTLISIPTAAFLHVARLNNGAVTIQVVDEIGKPVEGAMVQLFAITPPDHNMTSVEVFRSTTNARGVVRLELKGTFESITRSWRDYLEERCKGRSQRFYTALLVFVVYSDEEDLYLTCGRTVLYSPGKLLEGAEYATTVRLELHKRPLISHEELKALSEDIRRKLGLNTSLPIGSSYYAWVLERSRVYPQPSNPDYWQYYTPTARIPIAWSDSRRDSYPPAVYGEYSIWLEAGYEERVGVYAGACLGIDVEEYGANGDFEFKIADMTVAEEDVHFGKIGYIIRGEFTWIYVYAQIRYDEYQLYYVVYYDPFEPPLMYPLDRWWFESYISCLLYTSPSPRDRG